jgi:cellulose synthase/poly-beta-1,6-N-acetylglucosamine synthase-like glycosyltransferase
MTIAVLIPVYNEELVLKETIGSLKASFCSTKDIYVVDDCSTDKTQEIALSSKVNYYKVPKNGGKAKAQLQAIEHFQLLEKYDWVVFLDGDSKVDTMFISTLKEASKSNAALYVGQIKSVNNPHIYSASRAVEYSYGHDVSKHGQSNFNLVLVSPGCASMYRSDILAKLHFDDKTLAEDMDLTLQVHRLKEKILYVPEAIVNTQDPDNFKDYYKQISRWYRGFWQVVLKHKIFGWQKKQLMDFYLMFLIFDATFFNRIVWVVGLLFITNNLFQTIVVDVLTNFLVTCYGSYRTKRLDVLWKFPATYCIGFLGTIAYMQAFVEIVLMRKDILVWNKVKRYSLT